MHHVRRRLRGSDPGRSRWRRSYTYREDPLPWNPFVKIRTPMSHDAPIEPRDNRFWLRLDVLLVGAVLVVIALVLGAIWLT